MTSLHTLADLSDIFVVYDEELRHVLLSAGAEKWMGLPAARAMGLRPWELGASTKNHPLEPVLRRVLSTGRAESGTLASRVHVGRWLDYCACALEGVGVVLVAVDTTAEARDLELESARRRVDRETVPALRELVWHSTPDGVITHANDRFCRAANRTAGEIVGASLSELLTPRELAERSARVARLSASQPRLVVLVERPEGARTRREVLIETGVFSEAGDLIEVRDVAWEPDALPASIRVMMASHYEREVLSRELNHRIKNNLQMMVSFASVTARHATPEGRRVALSIRNRIHTMSALHEALLEGGQSDAVPMRRYFSLLLATLAEGAPAHVALTRTLDVHDDLRLGPDVAVRVGMIVTELLDNALRHAFVGRSTGVVALTAQASDGHIVVSVVDDGVGNGVAKGKAGVGSEILEALAAELSAQLDVQMGDGTKAVLRFSPNET